MLNRKPIIMAEGSESLMLCNYKYCHIAYALSVEIKFFTDLKYKEFENFLDGKYTGEQIEKFELTGRFDLD